MIYPSPRLCPFGDAALLVEFGDEISPAANDRVRAFDGALRAAAVRSIVETIPAYCSLLVEYDPLQCSFAALCARLKDLAGAPLASPPSRPILQVPTVYGGEFGPDLEAVAAAHDLTPDQVIALHSDTVYTVFMLGFSPGFAYMGVVPPAIATPRLATPRTNVPAGSVAIAGQQTGIYPQSTPGGWRILGRTNLVLFAPQRDPPCFFQPGDRVQFVPVPSMPPELHPATSEEPADTDLCVLEVVSPGLLTTVQDLGRWGYQRFGVPVSGAADAAAMVAANALVGNSRDAAGLEMTIAGPSLKFLSDALIAVTGADLSPVLQRNNLDAWEAPSSMAIYVRAGTELEFRGRRDGCRAYLAVAGGISVPPVMNSASTYLAGGMGGCGGRRLEPGDVLSVKPVTYHLPTMAGRSLLPEQCPRLEDHPVVRLVLGPHDQYFAPQAVQTLVSEEYLVSTTSDRMGLRLQGPRLLLREGQEMVSSGIALGAIQVPPNGQPIILMADRQTVGGYPIIGTVIRSDMARLAQCVPGQSGVRFRIISVEEAQAIYRAEARQGRAEQADPESILF